MTFECHRRLTASDIPNFQDVVPSSRCDPSSIRTEGYARNPRFVPCKNGFSPSRIGIPQLKSLVFPSGQNELAVWAEGYGANPSLVSLKSGKRRLGGRGSKTGTNGRKREEE